MTAHVLYEKHNLRLVDHKLIWWMLLHQEHDARGVPTGILPAGWRLRAMADVGVLQTHFYQAQVRLKRAGILSVPSYKREARICGEAFVLEPEDAQDAA